MQNSSQSALVQEASALVEARTGLSGRSQQRINLAAILDDLSGGDLDDFVRTLRVTSDSSPGWQRLMRALVIGETYFFRHRAHFDLLQTHILPTILSQRDDLNIWSAGCATGEESYSVAMTLYENLPNLSQRAVRIIGTDINAYALAAAREGIYRAWAFRSAQGDFQNRYFDRIEGGFQIKSFIRSLVTFRQSNLLSGPPLPQCDIIFCSNVLLYFDEGAASRAEDVLFNALAPGGWLILSPAEAVRSQRDRWMTHVFPGTVIYQKPASTTAHPVAPISIQQHTIEAAKRTTQTFMRSADLSYVEAVRLFRQKRYDQAETILKDILDHDPNHASAHTLYACLFANRGALAEANRHLDIALDVDSLHADSYYLKGILLLDSGRDEAAESFRAALYCQHGHPLAAMILGTLYLKNGDFARARRTWETALAALDRQPSDELVSDLSDMTAGGIKSFLQNQLESKQK
jgi:chemotaxis protein methyltransferase CheR